MEKDMSVLNIEVASLATSAARAVAAMETGEPQGRYLTFESVEALIRGLSGHRLAVLRAMLGRKEVGVRELARELRRDVRAVHNDVAALAGFGVLEKSPAGKLSCPCAEVHCGFFLKQAA
jgi:predicted transcriptional regulator